MDAPLSPHRTPIPRQQDARRDDAQPDAGRQDPPQNARPQDARRQEAEPQDSRPQDSRPQDSRPQDAQPQDAHGAGWQDHTVWRQHLAWQRAGYRHPRPPRTPARRIAILAGYLALWAAALAGLVAAAAVLPGRPWLVAAWSVAAAAAHLGVFAALAECVAYRRRDALALLVPLLGLAFAGKVLWRCTDLAVWRRPAG